MKSSELLRRLGSNPALLLLHLLLGLLIVSFVLLHTWGWGGHLKWWEDPISVFTSSAPGKNFGVACMILLGSLYLYIAGAMIIRMPHNLPATVSCIAITIAGALLFYVARYPAPFKRSAQSQKTLVQKFKEKLGWLDEGQITEKEIARVHGEMILGSTFCLTVSQIALIIALWSNRRRAMLARWTAALLLPTAALFYGAFNSQTHPGLYQRLGFILVLAWIWLVGRRFFLPRTTEERKAPVLSGAGAP